MNTSDTPFISPELDARLGIVLRERETIAAVLLADAQNYRGRQRRELKRLARFFSQPNLTNMELLQHPRGLAVCLPRLRRGSVDAVTQSWVRSGASECLAANSFGSRLGLAIVYPALLVLMCSILLVLYCVFLVPEFGLDLPPTTTALIGLSHLVQRYGLAVLIGSFVVLVAAAGYFLSPTRRQSRGIFESIRSAWASWAWHLSMLLRCDVSQADAIRIAGDSSDHQGVKRTSREWFEELRQGARSFSHIETLDGIRVQTLTGALDVADREHQAAMLSDVAWNYWDRDNNHSGWWADWLTPMTVTLVGIGIGFVVAAMLMPLVQLISGLT